jgi:hypothetical protein
MERVLCGPTAYVSNMDEFEEKIIAVGQRA